MPSTYLSLPSIHAENTPREAKAFSFSMLENVKIK